MAELQVFAERGGEWTLVDPSVEVKSSPSEADLEQCRLLGRNVAKAVKNFNA